MTKRVNQAGSMLVLSLLVTCSGGSRQTNYRMRLPDAITRNWIGPECWTNRLQDWRLADGRIECLSPDMPLRTVHLLKAFLGPGTGDFAVQVRTGPVDPDHVPDSTAFSGILIGAGSLDMDYRARALVHHGTGKNGGLIAGVTGDGKLVWIDNEQGLEPLKRQSMTDDGQCLPADIEIRVGSVWEKGSGCLQLSAHGVSDGKRLGYLELPGIDPERLEGNIALVSHGGSGSIPFWFRDWTLYGTGWTITDDHLYGPVAGVQHTLSRGTLKLTAQLFPIENPESYSVELLCAPVHSKTYERIAAAPVNVPGYTATWKVEDWNASRDFRYRIRCIPGDPGSADSHPLFEGFIARDPVDREVLVTAAFTGNSNSRGSITRHFDFTRNNLWFPHEDLTGHVAKHRPDLLIYTGDQIYEGRPTAADMSGECTSYTDYLYKWILFYWAHGSLTRNIASVSIPDDHDVYHGNLWGYGGRIAPAAPSDKDYPSHYPGFESHWQQDQGGYKMPAEFVRMAERTQTSHLPDPYDPAPAESLGVYFTSMLVGGVDFAILEDRKFKTPPSVLLPDAKIVNGFSQIPDFDTRLADHPEAELLGKRQERFLDHWSSDWEGVSMKASISQTVLATLSTYPDSFRTDAGTPRLSPLPEGVVPRDYRVSKDMDSNGWPQSGRNRALRLLRKGFAFMICGDQHLGSVIHHGVEDWEDAGYSMCVPSIANLWPRRWFPPEPGLNHQPGMPPYTGRYMDGFGNRITVHAVSNPYISNHEPAALHDCAPGYGILRFNKKERTITVECWPRFADPEKDEEAQYTGWPIVIPVQENYPMKDGHRLPPFRVRGISQPPVIQVADESSGEVVYTVRCADWTVHPPVPRPGRYTVVIGEPGTKRIRTFENLESSDGGNVQVLDVIFK